MIQVEKLTKIYGGTRAIDTLDFKVSRGEIVGFLGPNGAGKSTTMRILAGALAATSGRAIVGGLDVFEKPKAVKRIIGYLPEFPPLYVDMTVRGYLRFCAGLKGAKDPKTAVERAIERTGLKEVAHRLIDHLSKGYRQRVGIAMAIVHDPQVLILDEPTSGLDPAQRVEIRHLVRELAAGDTTVILSTHVLSEIEAICSRVIVIHRGQIVAQDQIDRLAAQASRVTVRVARPSDALGERLAAIPGVSRVESAGDGKFFVTGATDLREQIARVALDDGLVELVGERGLEDVFLRLTGGGA